MVRCSARFATALEHQRIDAGFHWAILEPTCFANTLLYLTRLRGPIRNVKSAGDLLSEEDAKNAPREVMRLVNYMMSGEGHVVGADVHCPRFG